MLQALKLCKGNNDFTDALDKRIDIKEPFPGIESERIAFTESSNGHGQLIKENFDIVRHINFEYIVKGKDRCQYCSALRNLVSIRQMQTGKSKHRNHQPLI